MIDLYVAATGNGQRAAIMLEETGLAYRTIKVNLATGEQQKPEFLAINPAGAIPAMVDSDGPGAKSIKIAQSGAITLYAAEKSGKFMPADPERRMQALRWLMHACTDCAVNSGGLFAVSVLATEKVPSVIELFETRVVRYLRVCDRQLEGRDYLADELSVADFALYPVYLARKALVDKVGDMPNLTRWGAVMAARPGVQRGIAACVA